MRDYGKVHTSFWTSETIRALGEDARTMAFYLLTSPHTTIAGVFRLSDGYACDDLQWEAERVSKGFAELFAKGFANRCETTKWVWIRKHLEWNPPENPNQRKAAAKCAASIPDNCAWSADFMRVCGPMLGLEAPPHDNPSGTLPEPLPNQEQEQEQKEERVSASADADAPERSDPIPYREIVAGYNRTLTALPKVRDITQSRKTAIRRVWQSSHRWQSLSAFDALWAEYADDDFHNGTGPYRNGHENWRPDFDYLIQAKVVTKVYERAMDRIEREVRA